MIDTFVNAFDRQRTTLRASFLADKPGSYSGIFKRLIEVLAADESLGDLYDGCPDPERITVIDHGHYQGTQLFVVGAEGYQPSTYWATAVYYGSCSGCDTFQACVGWGDETTPEEADACVTMALHMVQNMKQIGGYS